MNLESELAARFPDLELRKDFIFSKHTTVGIGGRAAVAAFPRGGKALAELAAFLQCGKVPYVVIGAGSNILVSDRGYGGVAVCTQRADSVRVDGDRVFCESGCRIRDLIFASRESGVGGFSFLQGIPATVGGAIFMNAGAMGKYICAAVRSVTAVENGKITVFSNEECSFSYKKTRFQKSAAVIVSAELQGAFQPPELIGEECGRVQKLRTFLPKERSMGCIFKNPPGFFAGKLIESCGLKGSICGGAAVSEKHANFIVNRNGASAEDFRRLIYLVKAEVLRRTGILLEEEIQYIGDF